MNITLPRLAFAGIALLAAPAGAATYTIDAGFAVSALGATDPNWSGAGINHFTAVAGSQFITSVSVVFGYTGAPTGIVAGMPFTVAVWNDPNGDGNPADATVISSAGGTITTFDDGVTFQTTNIPAVALTVGQSFFAGVYFQNYGPSTPGGVSLPGTPSESWIAFNPAAPLDLNNLSAAPAFGTTFAVTGQSVVIMARANGIPEPATATLAGLAALGLLRRRTRR